MRWTEPRRDSHIASEIAKTMRPIIAQSLKSSPTASRAELPRCPAARNMDPRSASNFDPSDRVSSSAVEACICGGFQTSAEQLAQRLRE